MGRSCGRAIVYRRLNTLSTDVVVYIRKKDTHMPGRKKMHIIEHLGTKEENPLLLCIWKKKEKEKGGVSLKKKMFLVGGYEFPGLPTTLNTFETWSQC